MTPRRHTGCRLGLIGYATILRDLKLKPMTADGLADKHGLTRNRAYKVLRSLHAVKLARIDRWKLHDCAGTRYQAVWGFGGAQDAPHPSPNFAGFGEPSKNLGATVITLSYLLRELVRSTCQRQLVEATGSDTQLISKFLQHGEAIGLCHIARWQFQRGGVTAFWRLGNAPSAPRPEPKPRSQISREHGERRKLRRQQRATFKALTHKIAQPFGGLLP
ncbi:MAG TPA: hypothetical protein VGF12_01005 [Roseateles sp.]|uniref:hypothetical protein n=1 Tax=Roseateles sp. TaxID=1971397 RepID=UPI002ED95FA8